MYAKAGVTWDCFEVFHYLSNLMKTLNASNSENYIDRGFLLDVISNRDGIHWSIRLAVTWRRKHFISSHPSDVGQQISIGLKTMEIHLVNVPSHPGFSLLYEPWIIPWFK